MLEYINQKFVNVTFSILQNSECLHSIAADISVTDVINIMLWFDQLPLQWDIVIPGVCNV